MNEVFRRLTPLIASLISTPFLLLTGLWSVGAGEGDYILATLLFPWPIIFGKLLAPLFVCPEFGDCFPRDGTILGIAVLQFPLYGLLFTALRKWKVPIAILALVHLVFFVIFWLRVGSLGFR